MKTASYIKLILMGILTALLLFSCRGREEGPEPIEKPLERIYWLTKDTTNPNWPRGFDPNRIIEVAAQVYKGESGVYYKSPKDSGGAFQLRFLAEEWLSDSSFVGAFMDYEGRNSFADTLTFGKHKFYSNQFSYLLNE